MTGEKIRSLRKDQRPSKDEDLLEPDEEAATGTFTASKTNNKSRASKIFSNHKLSRSSSTQQQPNQQSQINANTTPLSTADVIDDNNKNPVIRAAQDYPVHECVFKGDVRRLSSLIRTQNIAQKDVHGNTPLHLAVMMGHKECAHLLLAHNAPVKVKNAQGWSPLAEAISYGDRQMITALLRKLKQQSRESVEDKRPKLLTALKELGDFYLELHWDFQSWVPLLSRILPSDACKIYKQGINIRQVTATNVPLGILYWEIVASNYHKSFYSSILWQPHIVFSFIFAFLLPLSSPSLVNQSVKSAQALCNGSYLKIE
ncbi:ankyrin repeat domain-containing protein 13C-A [Boleophthalmus pectinirostris]|uniref:ankyrin repeat domain-containing protein 13C-A n=1 Tax=Boleophthalmus pectinirostris TaxID=150288 RepID=UPI00242D3C13|nr:ankyrin repeat domain-containing protein 13C-A [Boleophthalmus pectinirostris]